MPQDMFLAFRGVRIHLFRGLGLWFRGLELRVKGLELRAKGLTQQCS